MIPRYGRPPEAGRRYRARPGAYGLLVRDGYALMTLQTQPVADLQLPGGGVDPGEGQINALHREVLEETGWVIGSPRRIGAYRRYAWLPDYGFWAEKICTIWLARPVLQRHAPSEPHHQAAWLPLSDLPDAVSDPGSKALLRRWLG